MQILALASILPRVENIKSSDTPFFHLCLSGERQPLTDKNETDPGNLGKSLDPTQQHFVLFEHATGFALFRVKEFDEITRNFTAHVNAFIKPVGFVHFKSVNEAVENVQAVADGNVSLLLRQFIRSNVPPKSSVLGVSEESLGKAILALDFGFECVWHDAIREILRVIRLNFARLAKSLLTQPGDALSLALGSTRKATTSGLEEVSAGRVAESRARLVVALARARAQLNLPQHLADTAVVRALTLIDELDANLARSVTRLRASYTAHFPELCQPSFNNCPYLEDFDLIRLIASCPSRPAILESNDLESCLSDPTLVTKIKEAARDSIGCDLQEPDAENLKIFASRLDRMIQMRQQYADLLARRVKSLVPNLFALLGSTLPQTASTGPNSSTSTTKLANSLSAPLVAARLIANAGSVTRLANMPTSRVLSLGASKALFRKSGAVAAVSTGLLSTAAMDKLTAVSDETTPSNEQTSPGKPSHALTSSELKYVSANRLQPTTVRRRAARLLASKCSLACRADCFRCHNPAELHIANDGSSACPSAEFEDPRLTSGLYGTELGHDVRRQLRVWAETNGVHPERTEEQIKIQRERRKKYRKVKRKAWLVRKLSCAAGGHADGPNTVTTMDGCPKLERMDIDSDDYLVPESQVNVNSGNPTPSFLSETRNAPPAPKRKSHAACKSSVNANKASGRIKAKRVVSVNG
ncbi:hypothetical protein T265_01597 [Opisthorchis viverrini]|uniref:Nucleolar protein 56 n=1 Tax=Opisthorchis viverrini TaxID=6198 RepID=A0A075AIX1_OPIVI|nr:hypothetical protein T265_01597 [Opisthorchis viverrini]KER32374.1 hypothetical protein T265_01597 [Opisthorchis viverrini]